LERHLRVEIGEVDHDIDDRSDFFDARALDADATERDVLDLVVEQHLAAGVVHVRVDFVPWMLALSAVAAFGHSAPCRRTKRMMPKGFLRVKCYTFRRAPDSRAACRGRLRATRSELPRAHARERPGAIACRSHRASYAGVPCARGLWRRAHDRTARADRRLEGAAALARRGGVSAQGSGDGSGSSTRAH